MFMISYVLYVILILVSVAFFTMYERKILGYVHLRVGPNKNMFIGLGQPFNDLFKLFGKEDKTMVSSYMLFFFMPPLLMVLVSCCVWLFLHQWGMFCFLKYFFVLFLIMNSLNSFLFLLPGWSSGSQYSSLGGYRSSAQVISYEALFFFCILIFMMFSMEFSFSVLKDFGELASVIVSFFYVIGIWMCSLLAESNRSPFDFAEGESELVSGFNTEYGGGLFSMIFLAEYMSMLFLSFITSFFFSSGTLSLLILFFFMLSMFVFTRLSFPRMRYDKLMVASWKSLMFVITSFFFFYMFMIIF